MLSGIAQSSAAIVHFSAAGANGQSAHVWQKLPDVSPKQISGRGSLGKGKDQAEGSLGRVSVAVMQTKILSFVPCLEMNLLDLCQQIVGVGLRKPIVGKVAYREISKVLLTSLGWGSQRVRLGYQSPFYIQWCFAGASM